MPLNDHPSAKPTYDFYDTVPLGKTAIANGELVSQLANLPDANFPGGSTTWHWHSPEGIAVVPRREQHRLLRPERAPRGERDPVLRGAGLRDPEDQGGGEQGDHGHAGGHPELPERVQRAVPVHDGRRRDRRPARRLRGGDADEDHVRERRRSTWTRSTTRTCTSGGATTSPRRTTTSPSSRKAWRRSASSCSPRGTRRPRRAGRARRRATRPSSRASSTASTRTTRAPTACGRRAPSDPRPYTLFSGATTYKRPGHRLHRAAPDPRPGELRRRAPADPAHLPAGQHHRGAARGGRSRRSCRADRACTAELEPLLHAVVRHRLSARRRREQAADHRARARRRRLPLLGRSRLLEADDQGG